MTSDRFSVKGKTALITGASSGIGARIGVLLASEGANVILAARRKAKLDTLVHQINSRDPLHSWFSHSGSAVALELDVGAGGAAVEAAVGEAWKSFGRIDILVNNAGVIKEALALDTSEPDFDMQFNVNVKGVWLVGQAVAKRQAADGKGGSIINTGSNWGIPGGVASGAAAYSATKAAVHQLTRNLALEWGPHNIRVNAISPGLFRTEMSDEQITAETVEWYKKNCPVPRIGDASKDLDGPVLLLASDAGSYITGAHLIVDGGESLMLKSF